MWKNEQKFQVDGLSNHTGLNILPNILHKLENVCKNNNFVQQVTSTVSLSHVTSANSVHIVKWQLAEDKRVCPAEGEMEYPSQLTHVLVLGIVDLLLTLYMPLWNCA